MPVIMMTDFYKSVVSSSESKAESYTTADITDESLHWLDQVLQDVQGPRSA